MEAGVAAPKKRGGQTRKGKTINVEKVVSVETWAKYFARKNQNIVLGEDGSFLVLDPSLTKTDFPAALAEPAKTIPHLMGADYISVLANRASSSELRAAAEARRTELSEIRDAQVRAAKTAYTEAEGELMRSSTLWRNAPDTPSRILLAQNVVAANIAVAAAEAALRIAAAPHRYILKYSDLPRMMLHPGSGDDRPIKNVIYRYVPETTVPIERVLVVDGRAATAVGMA
jgi:hypothetical protein